MIKCVCLFTRLNRVICGSPSILAEEQMDVQDSKNLTVAQAKKEFADFAAENQWTEEEEQFIPVFEDDFLVPDETMKIPVMIAGHNCQDVPQICFYKMFEDHRSAKYSVNRMVPNGDNRDGLAIDVVTRFLTDRDEKDKLFLIISDGQPNASGYTGEPARQDISQIVRRLRTQEVKTIAFAIGDDKEQIHSIYGEAFVDITDHDLFPKTFSKLIEKEIISRL